MRELSLREIQLRELELLIKFADFCDEHGLRYSLCSGTLLGAVRHNGFIPWDDDIDVQMPRPDYIRFIDLTKNGKELSVVGYAVHEGFDIQLAPFVRVIDKNIHVRWKYSDNEKNIHLGIDVLPLDGLPSSPDKIKKIIKKEELLKYCTRRANARIGAGKNKMRALAKVPFVILCRTVGANRFSKMWTKLAKKYDFETSKAVCVIAGNYYGIKESVPKKEWCERVKVTFEGHEFWCMGCWKYHLQRLYGNYMELPPEKDRIGHHSYKAYICEE